MDSDVSSMVSIQAHAEGTAGGVCGRHAITATGTSHSAAVVTPAAVSTVTTATSFVATIVAVSVQRIQRQLLQLLYYHPQKQQLLLRGDAWCNG